MGKFLTSEKKRQTTFKKTSSYLSDPMRIDGSYRGKAYPFFLPEAYASENIYSQYRDIALKYFADVGIKWHMGSSTVPSSHLCSSQVCCVNFLIPFIDDPDALKALLLPLYPTISRMLPMEHQGNYVAFEWIGLENYLHERVPKGGVRTRGANFTSADAAVIFERTDGSRQIVLIEWKYTETYRSLSKEFADSGTDRKQIYAHIYEREDCPLDKSIIPNYGSLFYEPFYQLMRQQFLAHEMERANESGASEVTVLHIAPAHNQGFLKVTSLDLRGIDQSAIAVWKRIAKPNKFFSVCTEDLFGAFPISDFPVMSDWWTYLKERYSWLQEKPNSYHTEK